MPTLWRSRTTRFAVILTVVIGAASLIEVWWYPHYAAPFLAALLILVAQLIRYLRRMEVSRAQCWPFPGECNAGCGICSDDCLRGRSDCEASDSGSDSSEERAERAKGKH
jgi:hypothetical protein